MGRRRDARTSLVPRPLASIRKAVDAAREVGKLDVEFGKTDGRDRFPVRYTTRNTGGCRSPLPLYFRAPTFGAELLPGRNNAVVLEQRVPCRKCKWCRAMKAFEWGDRAVVEFKRHAVTWFGTLELSPEEHAICDLLRDQDTYGDPAYVFAARAKWMGRAVQRWLNLVRERNRRALGRPPEFKYLLAVEQHKGSRGDNGPNGKLYGKPHFHMLLHEKAVGELVTYDEYYLTEKWELRVDDDASLREAWPFQGWTQFKRLEPDEAWRCRYLCKYLGKDDTEDFRVRASKGYGAEDDAGADCGKEARTLAPLGD